MPREIITIQVGQCGNQIGMAFWDLLLREHSKEFQNQSKEVPFFKPSLSSFFKNLDSKSFDISNRSDMQIENLKARSIIVDTEEGVINQIMNGPLKELFNSKQLIHGVSGAGNNWAHGFAEYGKVYRHNIFEKLRKEVECADSLQCFLMFHSLGGGTGSGLGSYILQELSDEYPKIFRFTGSVFPSKNDDVIISPYNCVMSMNKLINFADCVFPIDNSSLISICSGNSKKGTGDRYASKIKQGDNTDNIDFAKMLRREASPEMLKPTNGQQNLEKEEKKKIHGKMNSIIAHLLSNLTCSMRFEGKLNVDLNEITMNLVPFPRLHFLMASMSPLQTLLNQSEPRNINQIFNEILLPENQLITCNPSNSKYLAMGLIIRGSIELSDVSVNIEKIKKQVSHVRWNKDGFKYGICNFSPIYNVS